MLISFFENKKFQKNEKKNIKIIKPDIRYPAKLLAGGLISDQIVSGTTLVQCYYCTVASVYKVTGRIVRFFVKLWVNKILFLILVCLDHSATTGDVSDRNAEGSWSESAVRISALYHDFQTVQD